MNSEEKTRNHIICAVLLFLTCVAIIGVQIDKELITQKKQDTSIEKISDYVRHEIYNFQRLIDDLKHN